MKIRNLIILQIILFITACATSSNVVLKNSERESLFEGVFLNPILGSTPEGFGLTAYIVKGLKKESIFYKAGFRNNNIILSVNNKKFSNQFSAGDLGKLSKTASKLVFEVKKGDSSDSQYYTIAFQN